MAEVVELVLLAAAEVREGPIHLEGVEEEAEELL
jgi:hypothetical protein